MQCHLAFPGGSAGKELACNAGGGRDVGSIPDEGLDLLSVHWKTKS